MATAVRLGLDGVNIDIEGLSNETLKKPLLTSALVCCELRTALRAAIRADATVSFDSLWSQPAATPAVIARGYDVLELSRCLDTIVPMDDLTANGNAANSPLPVVLHGIAEFKNLSVPLSSANFHRAMNITDVYHYIILYHYHMIYYLSKILSPSVLVQSVPC